MNRWTMFGVLVTGSSLVACGGADGKVEESKTAQATGTLAVQGHVSSKIALDKARAIAIARDGRTYWTHLDAQRDWTLKLPVGQAYRIVIANQRTDGVKGQVVVAKLVLDANAKSPWIAVKEGGTVDLGTLRPAATAGNVGVRCTDCDDDDDDDYDADHSDDNDCHESPAPSGPDAGTPSTPAPGDADDDDDDDADCDVCTSGSPGDVTPSKSPGSKCDADDDDDDDADTDKACH